MSPAMSRPICDLDPRHRAKYKNARKAIIDGARAGKYAICSDFCSFMALMRFAPVDSRASGATLSRSVRDLNLDLSMLNPKNNDWCIDLAKLHGFAIARAKLSHFKWNKTVAKKSGVTTAEAFELEDFLRACMYNHESNAFSICVTLPAGEEKYGTYL